MLQRSVAKTGHRSSEPGSLKNELRRSSKFEVSWVVQLLKHFYMLPKRSSLGRAALELKATPKLNFLRTGLRSQSYDF
jgi:hypothetical protein